MSEDIHIPPPNDGWIPTLNKMGFMTTTLDPVSVSFTKFATQAPGPALEIGAAYGIATLEALKQGAKVIANDIDERHLKLLEEQVPDEQKSNLTLKAGKFPTDLDFNKESVGAILICRVMHFFDGSQVDESVKKIATWLAPGGKAFVVCDSPYSKTMRKFIPEFEKNKNMGKNWPGFCENIHDICDPPELKNALPPKMHFFTPDILKDAFERAGMRVEFAETMARPDFPAMLRYDGRESTGLIALKI